MRRWASVSALLALAACGAPPASQPVPEQAAAAPSPAAADAPARDDAPLSASADAARDAVAAFVAAEARGDGSADTLLAQDADFIMGGILVTSRPRLAAMVGRGDAQIEEARVGTSGAFAYVVAVYRFDSPTPSLDDRARGTFILEKHTAGWRIRHVHSSMVERW